MHGNRNINAYALVNSLIQGGDRLSGETGFAVPATDTAFEDTLAQLVRTGETTAAEALQAGTEIVQCAREILPMFAATERLR